MKYEAVTEARFLSRPNRFIATVELEGKTEIVHVKNTGRCKELLLPNAKVFLEKSGKEGRKTLYDLIAVEKQIGNQSLLINMDSQAPNRLVREWLMKSGRFSPSALVRSEVVYERSRLDFCVEENGKKAYIEVKGVTLEEDGVALFPDAPTERGVKHIKELIRCKRAGHQAGIVFVVQMKGVKGFVPNARCHKEFASALYEARSEGVFVLCLDCIVTPFEVVIDRRVPLLF